MRAIISDVHANKEALTTVLEHIDSKGVTDIICLGDVVGYGPDPEVCIDLVEKRCRFCLSGNHDYATLTSPEHFNPLAEEAILFTRARLEPGRFSPPWGSRKKKRWEFLQGLPVRKRETESLFVHGSPRDERNEYILESDIIYGNFEKIDEILSQTPLQLFVGHSHLPGIITEDFEFLHPPSFKYTMELNPNQKYIINVGSVGQPRDGDNRACYVMLEGNAATYHRIAYDFETTMSKMSQIGEISREAAVRLKMGR